MTAFLAGAVGMIQVRGALGALLITWALSLPVALFLHAVLPLPSPLGPHPYGLHPLGPGTSSGWQVKPHPYDGCLKQAVQSASVRMSLGVHLHELHELRGVRWHP